ncbi:hypothetical protein PFICI_10602 [Pestalotiopsis fici W106-1]|uniref:Xylanolytic transcriptional activator regulatory domain-containing protein n=1 Tax=Pestalotiopsis fici (strain W106-1 / CGMCC3.15140) TaxID=1229662 RepID=W3WXG6_PESFW|nr:uncharacterized protein PFICI_10602 [Pestalotiopsis fici W106-1]ETS78540.1 hypothetical protein PFICI_10602 [Pestalotiopsis fici W106-1]
MSDTTSPLETRSNHTDSRSPLQSQHPPKRRRTSSHTHGTQERGLMRNGGESGQPRFIGSGSGIHFIRTVYDVLSRSAAGTRKINRNQMRGDLVPGEDDQLVDSASEIVVATPGTRASAPFWRAEEIIDDTAPGAPSINFDNLTRWTQSYFVNWHPAFPFLHGPEVLEIFEKAATTGIANVTEAEATIIRALLSISLADSRQIAPNTQEAIPSGWVFLNQGQIASSLVFALECPATLKNIQAAVCVQLFLVSMLRYNMASRLGGIIVRMAFHLGLYRCPARYSNFSPHEAAMRKRIWWSIYCLERIICQAFGHPLGIIDDDVDVCLPSVEIHGDAAASAVSDEGSEADPLLFLTLHAKHARLRGLILELRHKSIAIRYDTMERAMLVQSELLRWVNDVHERTADRVDIESSGLQHIISPISRSQRTLLSLMYHESVITLNRPLLASETKSPASQAAFQACVSASRSILDTIIMMGQHEDGNSFNNICVWPLQTWSVWMSSFILAYAALQGETTVSSAHKYAKKALYILKQLTARGTSWPESCAHGVEYLVSALQENQEGSGHQVTNNTLLSARLNGQRQGSASADPSSNTHAQDGNTTQDSRSVGPDTTLRNFAFNPAGLSQVFMTDDVRARTPFESQSWRQSLDQTFVPDGASSMDTYGQEWFDPMGVLDFSNFTQFGSTDTPFEFSFY